MNTFNKLLLATVLGFATAGSMQSMKVDNMQVEQLNFYEQDIFNTPAQQLNFHEDTFNEFEGQIYLGELTSEQLQALHNLSKLQTALEQNIFTKKAQKPDTLFKTQPEEEYMDIEMFDDAYWVKLNEQKKQMNSNNVQSNKPEVVVETHPEVEDMDYLEFFSK